MAPKRTEGRFFPLQTPASLLEPPFNTFPSTSPRTSGSPRAASLPCPSGPSPSPGLSPRPHQGQCSGTRSWSAPWPPVSSTRHRSLSSTLRPHLLRNFRLLQHTRFYHLIIIIFFKKNTKQKKTNPKQQQQKPNKTQRNPLCFILSSNLLVSIQVFPFSPSSDKIRQSSLE